MKHMVKNDCRLYIKCMKYRKITGTIVSQAMFLGGLKVSFYIKHEG